MPVDQSRWPFALTAFFGVVLVVSGVLCADAARLDIKPHAEASPPPVPRPASPPSSNFQPMPEQLIVTPQEIVEAFADNEVGAESRYHDQWLRMSAKVVRVRSGLFGPVIEISSGSRRNLEAYLAASQTTAAGNLRRGSRIELVCQGANMSVFNIALKDCRF